MAKYRCPSCGKGIAETQIVPVTVRLRDGKKCRVPDVEVDVCDACGDRIFSAESLRKIEDYKHCTGRLLLRLEPELHAKLLHEARDARRSLNQQINYLLEQVLKRAS